MNFLQNMQIPQLGSPSFSTDFSAFCNAIKENFERLISVQYTRGADGNSVVARTITIDAGLTDTDNVSPLGYAIISVLFPPAPGVSIPTTVAGINDYLENSTTGVAPLIVGGTHHCLPEYVPDPVTGTPGLKLTLVVDDHNGRAFLASPLVFIDGRITDLSDLASTMTNPGAFHDYSALVYGAGVYQDAPLIYNSNISSSTENQDPTKPETWIWDNFVDPNAGTIRLDVIPKLYYDDAIGEFCWLINGQKTHITAQGIKGEPGRTPKVIVAKGSPETGNPLKINLMEIENIDPSGQTISWEQFDPSLDCWKFQDGDLVLIFYKDDINIRHAFLGTVYWNSAGTQAFVLKDASGDDNIFDAISSQKFRNELLSIDRNPGGSYDPFATVRGLFLPAVQGAPTSNPGYVHMTYAEHNVDSVVPTKNISRLHSAVTPQGATYYDNGVQTPDPASLQGYIGDWTIDYNIGVQGNMETFRDLSVQGNIVIQGNSTVQGNMSVQGAFHAHEFVADGIQGDTISGRLGVVTTFKDIKYSCGVGERRGTGSSAGRKFHRYSVNVNAVMNVKIGIVTDCVNNPTTGNPYGVQSNNSLVNVMCEQYGIPNQAWGVSGNPSAVQNRYYLDQTDSNNWWSVSLPHSPKMYGVVEYNIPIDFIKNMEIEWGTNGIKIPDNYPGGGVTPNVDRRYMYYKGMDSSRAGDATCTIIQLKGTGYSGRSFIMDSSATSLQGADDQTAQYDIYSPIDQYKSFKSSSSNQTYEYQGSLIYEPFGLTISYNFDMLTHIYETFPGDATDIDDMKSRVYFTVSPVGCFKLLYSPQYAPVYGNISVQGYHPGGDIVDVDEKASEYLTNKRSSGDPNISEKCDYQRLNGIVNAFAEYPLVGHSYIIGGYGDGPVIISGGSQDVSFFSLFEEYINNTSTEYGRVNILFNLSSKYIDLTKDLRLYDNNLKICASNTEDGYFIQSPNGYKQWASNNKIYTCPLQRRGTIGDDGTYAKSFIENNLSTRFWDLGVYDAVNDLPVDGMLFYPYSPALVRLTNGSEVRTNDEYSGNDYYEGGRILGNTNQPTTSARNERALISSPY